MRMRQRLAFVAGGVMAALIGMSGPVLANAEIEKNAKNENLWPAPGRDNQLTRHSTLKDINTKKTREYAIVGSAEADPKKQRLSNESPVGRALLGRKKGETVTIPVPRGAIEYQIVKISRAPSEG